MWPRDFFAITPSACGLTPDNNKAPPSHMFHVGLGEKIKRIKVQKPIGCVKDRDSLIGKAKAMQKQSKTKNSLTSSHGQGGVQTLSFIC